MTAFRRSNWVMALSTLLAAAVLSASISAPVAEGITAGAAAAAGHAPASAFSAALGQPPGAVPGIDVSHHQDTIDWPDVAAAGHRFVFAKATEGRGFVDPLYAINKFNAQAAGLVFGAYHFARPDDSANDAVREADHFLTTAQLTPGNLIPVLDIERTGGLSHAGVTKWILTWLGRVTERLGVRPMIYTSPSGWATRTGDTRAVAEAGYTVLWVAHWGVDEPRLPADDWAGHGWTFWQYTSQGSVPGIEGRVDLDWYESGDFGPVTIPSPDVTAPVANLTPPAGVSDPMTVSFNEVVRRIDASNILIRVAETSLAVEASTTCRSGPGAEVDCATGNVRRVEVQPLAPLVPGEGYESVVNPFGVPVPVVDRSGNAAPETVVPFAAPTDVEETSVAASYAWRTVPSPRARGGSYAVERSRGATATFAFSGGSVTWYTAVGPAMGRAAIAIDGVGRGTFDQYGNRLRFDVAHRFTGLGPGSHTITVRVLGRRSANATDTQVAVDAFAAAGGVVASPELGQSWAGVDAAQASGGSLAASDLARASVTFTFRGTGVDWYTVRDPRQGRAEIYVDGVLVRTVDNYAANPAFGVTRPVGGLIDGVHTVRIVVVGAGRPAADGTFVSVDRFVVHG